MDTLNDFYSEREIYEIKQKSSEIKEDFLRCDLHDLVQEFVRVKMDKDALDEKIYKENKKEDFDMVWLNEARSKVNKLNVKYMVLFEKIERINNEISLAWLEKKKRKILKWGFMIPPKVVQQKKREKK